MDVPFVTVRFNPKMEPILVSECEMNHFIPVFDDNLENYLETLEQPMWIFDGIAGRNIWCNTAALATWNKASKEDFANGEAAAQSERNSQAAQHLTRMLVKEPYTDRPWTLYPDGRDEPVRVLLRFSGINYSGQFMLLVKVLSETTNVHDEVAAIAHEALRYSPSMISVIKKSGEIVLQNIEAESYYLEHLSVCVGKQADYNVLKVLLIGRDGSGEAFERMLDKIEHGQTFQETVQVPPFILQNGKECWHEIKISMQIHAMTAEEMLVINQTDVSELKYKDQRLLEMERSKLEAQKDRLVPAVSHELKTPLVGVIGLSEELLANRDLEEVVQESCAFRPGLSLVRSSIEAIRASGVRLLLLVEHLLQISQMKTDEAELTWSTVNYGVLVRKMCDQYLDRDVSIRLQMDPADEDIYLAIDIKGITTVLEVLLSNAFKFTQAGEVLIQLKSLVKNGIGCVTTSVSDSGIGIAEEDFDRVFELFEQGDNSETRQYEGAGVGLPLAKEVIEKHGGSIMVDSIKGVGSTFTFSLPYHSEIVRISECNEEEEEVGGIWRIESVEKLDI